MHYPSDGQRYPVAHFPIFMTAITTRPQTAPAQKPAWIVTDGSACKQKGRQLAPGVYEFKEKRYMGTPAKCKVRGIIALADYNEERRNYYAEAYYGSLAGLMKECMADWEWILAECIFEQESF